MDDLFVGKWRPYLTAGASARCHDDCRMIAYTDLTVWIGDIDSDLSVSGNEESFEREVSEY